MSASVLRSLWNTPCKAAPPLLIWHSPARTPSVCSYCSPLHDVVHNTVFPSPPPLLEHQLHETEMFFCFVLQCPSVQNTAWDIVCAYFSTASLEIRASVKCLCQHFQGARVRERRVNQEGGEANPDHTQPSGTQPDAEWPQSKWPGRHPLAPPTGQCPLPGALTHLHPWLPSSSLRVHWVRPGQGTAEMGFEADAHSRGPPRSPHAVATESTRAIKGPLSWEAKGGQADPGPSGLSDRKSGLGRGWLHIVAGK